MERLQLIAAWIFFVGAICLFASAIYNSSPMKGMYIGFVGIILVVSYFLLRLGYKEYREEKHE